MSEPTYYAIIPAEVRYDKQLSAAEKLLYGEITCLTNKTGICSASNSYFARIYDVDNSTVSRWITKLNKLGYIDVQLVYNSDYNQVLKREIKLNKQVDIPKKREEPAESTPF